MKLASQIKEQQSLEQLCNTEKTNPPSEKHLNKFIGKTQGQKVLLITAVGQGEKTGTRSINYQRTLSRLCIRPYRGRLRSDIQGNRDGQLRSGRIHDVGGISSLHIYFCDGFALCARHCLGNFSMAGIGALIERMIIRPMIGEPHFSVLMITIGLGFILRALAGFIWGNEPKSLATPYSGKVLRIQWRGHRIRKYCYYPGNYSTLFRSCHFFFKNTTWKSYASSIPKSIGCNVCWHFRQANKLKSLGQFPPRFQQ